MEVCTGKVECKVAVKRMWLAAFADAHTFLPKALPQAISHVTYEGPAFQAGSFRIIHANKSHAEQMAKETHQERVVLQTKDRLDEVDHKAFKLKFETVDGGLLGILVKSVKQINHIEKGTTPNTCVVHWSFEYEPLSKEHQAKIPPTLNEWLPRGFKQVEEYLLTHDDYKEA